MTSEVDPDAEPGPPLPPNPAPPGQGRIGAPAHGLSWPAFAALAATLALDTALAAAVSISDVGYGQGIGHFLGLGLWIAVAIINGFAVWNVVQRRRRWFANVLLAQVLALVMAVYVLWSDVRSPDPNATVRWVAAAVALGAAAWIVFLIAKAPGSSAHAFGTSWRVIAAGFSLLGLVSLWLQTSYLPSQQRPMVDVTTTLVKQDQTDTTTVLKATITLHNRGLANAVVVGSLYRVTVQYAGDLQLTGPVSGVQAFAGNNLALTRPSATTTHADDELARAFDFTEPNDHDFIAGGARGTLLRADEIAPMREFLLPGQTWSTDVVVRVPTASPETVRLTAQVALITDRYLGETRACHGGTVDQLSPQFLDQAQQVSVSRVPEQSGSADGSGTPNPAVNRRIDSMCVQTALSPQSAVQDVVGDKPSIRTYYVLADGLDQQMSDEQTTINLGTGWVNGDVPYLLTTYQNGTGSNEGVSQARAIDSENPSAVIESRSEYGIPGTPATTVP